MWTRPLFLSPQCRSSKTRYVHFQNKVTQKKMGVSWRALLFRDPPPKQKELWFSCWSPFQAIPKLPKNRRAAPLRLAGCRTLPRPAEPGPPAGASGPAPSYGSHPQKKTEGVHFAQSINIYVCVCVYMSTAYRCVLYRHVGGGEEGDLGSGIFKCLLICISIYMVQRCQPPPPPPPMVMGQTSTPPPPVVVVVVLWLGCGGLGLV